MADELVLKIEDILESKKAKNIKKLDIFTRLKSNIKEKL